MGHYPLFFNNRFMSNRLESEIILTLIHSIRDPFLNNILVQVKDNNSLYDVHIFDLLYQADNYIKNNFGTEEYRHSFNVLRKLKLINDTCSGIDSLYCDKLGITDGFFDAESLDEDVSDEIDTIFECAKSSANPELLSLLAIVRLILMLEKYDSKLIKGLIEKETIIFNYAFMEMHEPIKRNIIDEVIYKYLYYKEDAL